MLSRYRVVAAGLVAFGASIPFATSSCGDGSPAAVHDTAAPLPEGGLGLVNGLPIVMRQANGQWTDVIVYDESLHDPLTDWGGCVDRVRACYRSTAQGAPIAGCIAKIKPCSDKPGEEKKGGDLCCPKQCITDFANANKGDEDDAVNATFGEGGCVAGLTDLEQVSP
jgi:hypothetical protein